MSDLAMVRLRDGAELWTAARLRKAIAIATAFM